MISVRPECYGYKWRPKPEEGQGEDREAFLGKNGLWKEF